MSEALPRWRAFPPLAIGAVMATLDISVVNIALPTLSRTFGVPLTRIEWVVLAYVVTITGLLLSVGRFADRTGRRRVYAAGLLVFAAASALCGVAPTAAALVAARVLQGVGAAFMTANSAALLVSSFPEGERGRALGAFGASVGVGLAIGTPLGGLVIQHASWRWLFFLNLPLAALAAVLLPRVPESQPARAAGTLGLGASAVWCAALVALMTGLSRGPERGFASPDVWPLFAAALALFAAFALIERRSRDPLLPLRLVQGPLGILVSLTLATQALSIAVGFHMPLYLEEVLGFDAGASGRWMGMLPAAALVSAPVAGRLSDRFGTRPVGVLGMTLATIGLALLAGLGTEREGARVLGGLALVGVGLGLFTVPNAAALLSLVPRDLLGFAAGLQGTMRNLGIAGGAAGMAAAVASVYARRAGHSLPAAGLHATDVQAFAAASRAAYVGLAAIAAACALVAARVPGRAAEPASG